MPSIFSKIISGEITAHREAESKDYLAFLDIQPLSVGHVLVVPKKEVDYIFDLDDDTYTGLMNFAKTVARGLKKAVTCIKLGVAEIV
jgi:histidine triad (HIT) family protein